MLSLPRAQDPATGNSYYYNKETGCTQWTMPPELLKEQGEAAEARAWMEIKDATTGKVGRPCVPTGRLFEASVALRLLLLLLLLLLLRLFVCFYCLTAHAKSA